MLIQQSESLRIGQREEERTASPAATVDRAVVMYGCPGG
jgi:hypothetical protein